MLNVTTVMPMCNEAADIADVLASLSAQTFPHDAIHVIIVDGASSDGSRQIAAEWLAGSDFSGDIIDNPRSSIPVSLNLGIARAAAGSIIVRLDAHTTYTPDYIERIVAAFATAPYAVACIGGAQTPAPEQRLDLALVTALYSNPLGLGGAGFRRATEPQLVQSVYLGAWRPGVLQAVGGFDERWVANEDGELAARLKALGYHILFIPVASSYRVKRSPLAVIRQWGRYGYWRAQTLRRHLAQPLALVGALLMLLTPLRPLTAVFYAAYVAGIWAMRSKGEPVRVTLASCVFFPACQAAWAVGLLRGSLSPPAGRKHGARGAQRHVRPAEPRNANGFRRLQ